MRFWRWTESLSTLQQLPLSLSLSLPLSLACKLSRTCPLTEAPIPRSLYLLGTKVNNMLDRARLHVAARARSYIQVSRLQWRGAFTSVIELTLNSWCYKQTSPSARDAMLFTFVPNNISMRNTYEKWGPEKISHFLNNVSKPVEILRKFQVILRHFFQLQFVFFTKKKILIVRNFKKFVEKNSEHKYFENIPTRKKSLRNSKTKKTEENSE